MTTRERIVETACKMFIQSGVRNVTMSDIAGHLGMSKRTIYEHVANKEELIEECILLMEVNNEMMERLDVGKKTIDQIKLIIGIGTGVMMSELKAFVLEVKKYHPVVFANTIKKNREKRFKKTVGFIEKGVVEGLFRKNMDVELMALLVSNIFVTFEKNDDLLSYEKRETPEVFEAILLLLCRGMATKQGMDQIDEAFNIEIE